VSLRYKTMRKRLKLPCVHAEIWTVYRGPNLPRLLMQGRCPNAGQKGDCFLSFRIFRNLSVPALLATTVRWHYTHNSSCGYRDWEAVLKANDYCLPSTCSFLINVFSYSHTICWHIWNAQCPSLLTYYWGKRRQFQYKQVPRTDNLTIRWRIIKFST
jgi:hypothetical protein